MADVEPRTPTRRRTPKPGEAPSHQGDSRYVEGAAVRASVPEEPAASAMSSGGLPVPGRTRQPVDHRQQSANLADILERVLDKGIVIVGDIRVNLLDIELLTIKIRLLIASVDKAREIGIDWWEHDPTLSSGQRDSGQRDLAEENRRLRERIGELETRRITQRKSGSESPRVPVKGRVRKSGSDG